MADPVGFLQALIGAQKDGEAAVQRLVADAARALGCTVEDRALPAGRRADGGGVRQCAGDRRRTNAKASSPPSRGRASGRSVIFFAHPDGEPLANTESWQRDPFAGVIDNGRLHGWGVADDLSGVAILVQGLQAVLDAGQVPAGDVILASTPSKRHARGVLGAPAWRIARRCRGLSPSRRIGRRHARDQGLRLGPARVPRHRRGPRARHQRDQPYRLRPQGGQSARQARAHPSRAAGARCPARRRRSPSGLAGGDRTVDQPAGVAHGGRQRRRLRAHCRATPCCRHRCPSRRPRRWPRSRPRSRPRCAKPPRRTIWLCDHPPRHRVRLGRHRRRNAGRRSALSRRRRGHRRQVTGETPLVNPLHTSSDIRNPIVQAGIPTVGLGPLGGDLHAERIDRRMGRRRDYRGR